MRSGRRPCRKSGLPSYGCHPRPILVSSQVLAEAGIARPEKRSVSADAGPGANPAAAAPRLTACHLDVCLRPFSA